MAVEEPQTVYFRRTVIWSTQLLWITGALALGAIGTAILGHSKARLSDPLFWPISAAYIGIIAALLVAWRYRVRRRGGTPPLHFETRELVAPIAVNRLRRTRISYSDIRALIRLGKGWTDRVILDTRAHVMVYPIREFASPKAFEQLRDILRARVEANPDGSRQWTAMEARAAVAERLAGIKPWLTYGFAALLALIFVCQWITTSKDLLFGAITWGANSLILINQGQWFRLATANLLHFSPSHFLFNLLSLTILGMIVERQMGAPRYVLLLLSSGLCSQLASAFIGQQITSVLCSVGVSGIIFGVLGALAVLNCRFGRQLPAGYRFPARAWWIMLVVNLVALPMVMRQLDSAAHVGGLLSGAAITWWLCRGQTDVIKRPALTMPQTWALCGLVAVWMISVASDVAHAADSHSRQADRSLLAQHVLDETHPQAVLDNEVAWALATQPAASPDDLASARRLVQRALSSAQLAGGRADSATWPYTDTLATVQDRLGNFGAALALEESLLHSSKNSEPYASQFARFLRHYVADNGVRILGDSALKPPTLRALPSSAPDTSIFKVVLDALPQGETLTVLLLRHAELVAYLHLKIGATASRTLKVTIRNPALHRIAGSELTLQLAQFDNRGCVCAKGSVSAALHTVLPEIAALP
jgi:membrane associated rhomboid family serine protease